MKKIEQYVHESVEDLIIQGLQTFSPSVVLDKGHSYVTGAQMRRLGQVIDSKSEVATALFNEIIDELNAIGAVQIKICEHLGLDRNRLIKESHANQK